MSGDDNKNVSGVISTNVASPLLLYIFYIATTWMLHFKTKIQKLSSDYPSFDDTSLISFLLSSPDEEKRFPRKKKKKKKKQKQKQNKKQKKKKHLFLNVFIQTALYVSILLFLKFSVNY